MGCKNCGGTSAAVVAAAAQRLELLYDSDKSASSGRCPIDGGRAVVTFFRHRGARIAYRKCPSGHHLRL